MTKRIVAGSAGFVLAGLGMVVMAGWYADSATLVRLHADWPPMPFNEALCFAVLGAALIAGACGLRLVCATCGAVVVLIAGATFILIHKQPKDPAAASEALKFFKWAYAEGGPMADALDYVSLPASVVELIQKSWRENIKGVAF